MAEAVLKNKIKVLDIKSVKIESAGLNVEQDAKITDNARKALSDIGIKNVKHKARPLTKEMCKNACVICMTSSHKQRLQGIKNLFSAGDLIGEDILDPYGGDLAVYKNCLKQIEKLAGAVLVEIKTKKGI